ncbi:FkbM family methyltransferase [Alkalinema sp. FACHB-956]|uniref:FkbM family methyltransferase n=1 Tax=Alkalinema sp. FACHB-956 TaxID=2692768 RepID=UPI00168779A1|nr:FkbM family methyltransferase [Alkalinema sp. FACHB-956]MBD2329621.1 FkbM family methyltransferase [Alkalinema sp. FACHB-956]
MSFSLMISRFTKIASNLQRVPEAWWCMYNLKNWWGFLFRFLGLVNQYPFDVMTRKGYTIRLKDFYDVTTVWVIFCKFEYKIPKDCKVIVDLGANIGSFAIFAAQHEPDVKVICLEPFPSTFRQLEENIVNNQLSSRITTLPLAISSRRAICAMATGGFGSTTSHLVEAEDATGVETVSAIRFPDLLDIVEEKLGHRRIDLLKIDIEGGEHDLFQNMTPEYLNSVQEIQMEHHRNGSKDALFDKLNHLGFICKTDYIFSENFGTAHFLKNVLPKC